MTFRPSVKERRHRKNSTEFGYYVVFLVHRRTHSSTSGHSSNRQPIITSVSPGGRQSKMACPHNNGHTAGNFVPFHRVLPHSGNSYHQKQEPNFSSDDTSTMTPYVATRIRQHVILTRKVILITGLYLVCWIPFQVMITIFSACPHGFLSNDDIHCGISGNRFTVPATMATMNSLVNSIVYIFAFKKFRKALKEMVWCTREKQGLVTTDSIATVTEPSRDKPQTLKS